MTTPRSRLRQRLVAVVSAGALAFGALSLGVGPALAAPPAAVPATTSGSGSPVYVDNATFAWGVSGYAQKGIFGPWTFKDFTGNAAYLNGASQTEYTAAPVPATSMPAAGGSVPANPNAVKFSQGTGAIDTATGAGKLSWTGSYTVNGYPPNFNAPNEIYKDPVLTIAANGSGTLTANFGIGAGTDQSGNPFDAVDYGRLTLANFDAGSLSGQTAGGYRATPKYQSVTNGLAGQTTTCPAGGGATGWWGSWPTGFITALNSSPAGQSVLPHFYSTGCGGMQDNKPQLPLDVKYTADKPAPTVTISNTKVSEVGATTVTVSGSGFHYPLSTGTRPPLSGVPAGSYIAFGKFADVWRPSLGSTTAPSGNRKTATAGNGGLKWAVPAANINGIGGAAAGAIELKPDGTFSTDLVINKSALDATAGAGTEAFKYGIYTYGGSGASAPSYETYTPVTFFQPGASTITFDKPAYAGTPGDTVPVEVTISGEFAPAKATGTVKLSLTPQGDVATEVDTATLVDGKATLELPDDVALGAGALSVAYSGDGLFAPKTEASTYTISKIVPTLDLEDSYGGAAGVAIPVDVTVAGPAGKAKPTGTVTLTHAPGSGSGGGTVGPVALVDGKATLTLPSTLPAGAGDFQVTYSGNDTLYQTASRAATYEIGKNAATVNLNKPEYTGTAGSTIPVVATVTGTAGDPTGTATLKYTPTDGTEQTLAAVALVDGKATLTLPDTLAAGSTGTVKVTYNGDGSYLAKTESSTYAVARNTTSVGVAAKYTGPAGAVVPVAITVTTPAGQPEAAGPVTVTYGAGQNVVGTVVEGEATVNLPSTLAVGTGTLAVSYAGNGQNEPSSAGSTFEITKAAATVSLSKASYSGAAGAVLPVEVTVSGPAGTPTGAVTLTYQPTGGAAASTAAATLSGGKATVNLPGTLAAGSAGALEVAYGGSATYLTATKAADYTIAAKTATTVALSAKYSGTVGAVVPVAVSVTGAGQQKPTGAVALRYTPSGGTEQNVAPVNLVNGAATVNLPSTLAAGTGALTVSYAGDALFLGSTGSSTYEVAKETATLTLDKTSYTGTTGTAVPVEVTVTGTVGTPTGSVALTYTPAGGSASTPVNADLVAGKATVQLPGTVGAGTGEVNVSYAGSSTYGTATDAATYALVKKGTSISIAGPASVAYRTAAKYTATVTNGATGNVKVTGANVTYLRPIVNGKATFVLPATLSAGARTLKFEYAGDGNTGAATAATKKITIAKGAVAIAAKVTSKWAADQSGRFRVTIKSVKGGPVPVGKVSLTLKKGSVTKKISAKFLANGKVVFKLPKSSQGTWTVKATYAGTSQHAAVKKAWKVKVKAS